MEITHIDTIAKFNQLLGVETLHPLVSVIDFSKISFPQLEGSFSMGFYFVSIKGDCSGEIRYGKNKYDYEDGTMIFTAPNQVLGIGDKDSDAKTSGMGLVFHPDLLRGEQLAYNIKDYHYFDYEINESLHLSESERKVISECMDKIIKEISRPIDKHSRHIIVSNIELLLGYCQRFYDRQFITREFINKDTLSRFESVLNKYFSLELQKEEGLPTVKYIAQQLALSPNYMSDLIKKETGRSAIEHIQDAIIERAKIELSTTKKSISEIAYNLGYEYPQYFSRQFKKISGMTPNEFRVS